MLDLEQQGLLPPLICNRVNHYGQEITSLCLSQKCNEPSAQCQQCTQENHQNCASDNKMLQDIPKLLRHQQEKITALGQLDQKVKDLMMIELMNSKIYSQTVIQDYQHNGNLANLNNVGQMLKQETQLNIQNQLEKAENKIKRSFEECKQCFKPKNSWIQNHPIVRIIVICLVLVLLFIIYSNQILDVINSHSLNKKGLTLYNEHKFQQAIECYQVAIYIDPKLKQAWMNKGVVLNDLTKYQEAIDCYQEAINIDRKYRDAWLNKGIALQNLNKHQEAIYCYQQAILLNPKDYQVWNNKGFALYNLNKFKEAIDCFQEAINIDRKQKQVWYNKGNALHQLQRYQEEIDCYLEAINIDPKYTYAMNNLNIAKQALEN